MPINSIQEATTYAETLFKHAAWQDILSHHLDVIFGKKTGTDSSSAFLVESLREASLSSLINITSKEDLALILLNATEKHEECMSLITKKLTEYQIRDLFITILLSIQRDNISESDKFNSLLRRNESIVRYMLIHFLREAKQDLSNNIKANCLEITKKIRDDQKIRQRSGSYIMSQSCGEQAKQLLIDINNTIIEFIDNNEAIFSVLSVLYGTMLKDKMLSDEKKQQILLGTLANRFICEIIINIPYPSNEETFVAGTYIANVFSHLIINPLNEGTLSKYPGSYKDFLCDSSNRQHYINYYYSLSPSLIECWSIPECQNPADQEPSDPKGKTKDQPDEAVHDDQHTSTKLPKPQPKGDPKHKTQINYGKLITDGSPVSSLPSEKPALNIRRINLQGKQIRFWLSFANIYAEFQILKETIFKRHAISVETVTKAFEMQLSCVKSRMNFGGNTEFTKASLKRFETINGTLQLLSNDIKSIDKELFPSINKPYSSESFKGLAGQLMQFQQNYRCDLNEDDKELLDKWLALLNDWRPRLTQIEDDLYKESAEKDAHQPILPSPRTARSFFFRSPTSPRIISNYTSEKGTQVPSVVASSVSHDVAEDKKGEKEKKRFSGKLLSSLKSRESAKGDNKGDKANIDADKSTSRPGSPPRIPLTLSGDITGSPAQSPRQS